MTEQIKVWAILDAKNNIVNLYDFEPESDYVYTDYSVVKLTSTPKIKMTQAEFDTFLEVKEAEVTLYGAFEFMNKATNILYPRVFGKGQHMPTDNTAQNEFARLWASDNPAELVEIEKEQKYYLVSKLNNELFVGVKSNNAFSFYILKKKEFTQSEIDNLGGNKWLAEMGLKKVEVQE